MIQLHDTHTLSIKAVIKPTDEVKIVYNTDMIHLVKDMNHDIIDIDHTTDDTLIPSFNLSYSYSYDNGRYWTSYKPYSSIEDPVADALIRFRIEKIKQQTDEATRLGVRYNINKSQHHARIIAISINGSEIDLEKDVELKSEYQIVDQYPVWNIHDHQNANVEQWVAQCNALAHMYGVIAVYFRTIPSNTIHTLRNHYDREVVAVKKIHVMFPEDDMNVDKLIYSEWDMPLQDDFICHILWDKFKIAFGENAIPNEKDYLFLPLLNRFFRVGPCQPINGFMGKVAWFETNLIKYEDDESVTVSKQLKDDIETIPAIDEALDILTHGQLLDIDGTDYINATGGNDILDMAEKHVSDSLNSAEKISEKTIIEKRNVTDSYFNQLVDNTNYVSLKETEAVRSYYDKRLSIIQVKPDTELYSVTMYDCRKVKQGQSAMVYDLRDFRKLSKTPLLDIKEGYELSFDFVTTGKKSENNIIRYNDITISLSNWQGQRDNMTANILYTSPIGTLVSDHKILPMEIYRCIILKDIPNQQLVMRLFTLKNKKRTEVWTDIYKPYFSSTYFQKMELLGGNYLLGNICLNIDGNQIFVDKCNPLLIMNTP